MPPWKNFSITIIRSHITFPAASSTKVGATVTKLTTIEDGPVSGFLELMYSWRILNRTPSLK